MKVLIETGYEKGRPIFLKENGVEKQFLSLADAVEQMRKLHISGKARTLYSDPDSLTQQTRQRTQL